MRLIPSAVLDTLKRRDRLIENTGVSSGIYPANESCWSVRSRPARPWRRFDRKRQKIGEQLFSRRAMRTEEAFHIKTLIRRDPGESHIGWAENVPAHG